MLDLKPFLTLIGAVVAALAFSATLALADQESYVRLAQKGWNYQLRTTMLGRDMSIPVEINGRNLAGASLCIVGEEPHPLAQEVIAAFGVLLRATYGKPFTTRYAGRMARDCGTGRSIVLRLYSGYPPNQGLREDLAWMNRTYLLGLSSTRNFSATSPAIGQTFFGRRGQATHVMVKQPAHARLSRLEQAFYKSILIEELYQSFTFGMDILLFDRSVPFESKLQETPFSLYRLPWETTAFMTALVKSNPRGLCLFDVFMMHAVANAPVEQTNDPAFITYVQNSYSDLLKQAQETLGRPELKIIAAPECRRAQL